MTYPVKMKDKKEKKRGVKNERKRERNVFVFYKRGRDKKKKCLSIMKLGNLVFIWGGFFIEGFTDG